MSIVDLLKSKITKVGGGIVGGSGIFIIAMNLMNDKIDTVSKGLDEKDAKITAMVDYKHTSVMAELNHLSDQQKEMKLILEKIDQRVYEMNKKQVYSELEGSRLYLRNNKRHN